MVRKLMSGKNFMEWQASFSGEVDPFDPMANNKFIRLQFLFKPWISLMCSLVLFHPLFLVFITNIHVNYLITNYIRRISMTLEAHSID